MKSSMFTLWLITGILSYAHKIPYIGRIIALFSFWYGRTTWWKILLKLRKLFVTFNAIIGVYMVFKVTGFSTDNLFAGFAGMGHTYFEILINFSKRLFHWFFDLFDHKVVPNLPGEGKPSFPKRFGENYWSPRGLDQSWNQSLPKLDKLSTDLFKSPFGINLNPTPWYKDLSTWLWIGGAITMAAGSLGIIYLGYKLTTDPGAIWSIFKSGGGTGPETNVTPATPPTDGVNPDTIQANIIIKSIKSIGKNLNKLNPYYWFLTPSDFETKHHEFILQQQSTNYDVRYYPFTEVNPYFNTLHKWRIAWLGENYYESEARRILAQSTLAGFIPQASDTVNAVASSSKSMLSTPSVTSVGLNTGFMGVKAKLASFPSTPVSRTLNIINLPDTNNPFNDTLDDAISRLNSSNHGSDVEEGSPSCEAG